jgi:hypothetical protein
MDVTSVLRWMISLRQQKHTSDCCKDLGNMAVESTGYGKAIGTCIVCGKKHYWVKAEPGTFLSRR